MANQAPIIVHQGDMIARVEIECLASIVHLFHPSVQLIQKRWLNLNSSPGRSGEEPFTEMGIRLQLVKRAGTQAGKGFLPA